MSFVVVPKSSPLAQFSIDYEEIDDDDDDGDGDNNPTTTTMDDPTNSNSRFDEKSQRKSNHVRRNSKKEIDDQSIGSGDENR